MEAKEFYFPVARHSFALRPVSLLSFWTVVGCGWGRLGTVGTRSFWSSPAGCPTFWAVDSFAEPIGLDWVGYGWGRLGTVGTCSFLEQPSGRSHIRLWWGRRLWFGALLLGWGEAGEGVGQGGIRAEAGDDGAGVGDEGLVDGALQGVPLGAPEG